MHPAEHALGQVCEEGMAPPLPSQSLQDEETQIVEDDVESKRLEPCLRF